MSGTDFSFSRYAIIQAMLPREFQQGQNPFTMMLDNISYKHFYASICRKVGEFYKANYADTTLTSFDVKVGFGDQQVSDDHIDHYYRYATLAYLHGPNHVTIYKAIVFLQILFVSKFSTTLDFYEDAILSVTVAIEYWMISLYFHLKEIPLSTPDKEMQWCVQSFMQLWRSVLPTDVQMPDALESQLLQGGLEYFFLLTHAGQWSVDLLPYGTTTGNLESYIQEWGKFIGTPLVKKVLTQYVDTKHHYQRSSHELQFLDSVMKQDNYATPLIEFFQTQVGSLFFTKMYDQKQIHVLVTGLMRGDHSIQDIRDFCLDMKIFKQNFIIGAKSLIFTAQGTRYDPKESKEVQSFLERIEAGNISMDDIMHIPQTLKQESDLMSMLMQFYFHHVMNSHHCMPDMPRIQHLFSEFMTARDQAANKLFGDMAKQSEMQKNLIHTFTTNLWYYHHGYRSILQGSDRFVIPIVPQRVHLVDELSALRQIYHQYLCICIGDMVYTHDIPSASSAEINIFRTMFESNLETSLSRDTGGLLQYIYGLLFPEHVGLLDVDEQYIHVLKTSLYRFDMQLRMVASKRLLLDIIDPQLFSTRLSTISMGILRQTILGILIYIQYLYRKSTVIRQSRFFLDVIFEIITREVLFLPHVYTRKARKMLDDMQVQYSDLLDHLLDPDTTQICEMITQSLQGMIIKHRKDDMINIGHEDVIWLRQCFIYMQLFTGKSYIP